MLGAVASASSHITSSRRPAVAVRQSPLFARRQLLLLVAVVVVACVSNVARADLVPVVEVASDEDETIVKGMFIY